MRLVVSCLRSRSYTSVRERRTVNALVAHFGSGDALFTGAALMALSTGLRRFRATSRFPASLLGTIGAVIVAFSAVPLPLWFYALWGGCFVAWAVLQRKATVNRYAERVLSIVLAIYCAGAVLMEIPWHRTPRIPGGPYDTVCLIGDSISAGLGERETWPKIFQSNTGVEVVDLSRAGATSGTAMDAVNRIPSKPCLVLLEIGGNDLLGPTSTKKYREDLDRLLNAIRSLPGSSDRAMVMLELPLPPGRNNFGAIQRELSQKYDVALVPRRFFMGVLAGEGNTVDGIHLSPAGHRAMAAMIQRALGPALGASSRPSRAPGAGLETSLPAPIFH